jgi:hypothetical protein
MRMIFHGGRCCGFKHIYGLGTRPDYNVDARAKQTSAADYDGCEMSVNRDFYIEACPRETYLKRLDRYVDFYKK